MVLPRNPDARKNRFLTLAALKDQWRAKRRYWRTVWIIDDAANCEDGYFFLLYATGESAYPTKPELRSSAPDSQFF